MTNNLCDTRVNPNKKPRTAEISRMLPPASKATLKQVEAMRLRDGMVTPEMCCHLDATEIVTILLNVNERQ